jgi:Na+/glutamate symporter
MDENAKAIMVVEMIAASYAASVGCSDAHGRSLTSSPTSVAMMLTRMWKNGTASIIIEPLPPGKILPPRENTSCETIQLD